MDKKVVFVNIVDGTGEDYNRLRGMLASIARNQYEFVVAPKQIQSIGLDEIKQLVEVLADDKQ